MGALAALGEPPLGTLWRAARLGQGGAPSTAFDRNAKLVHMAVVPTRKSTVRGRCGSAHLFGELCGDGLLGIKPEVLHILPNLHDTASADHSCIYVSATSASQGTLSVHPNAATRLLPKQCVQAS